MALLSAAKTDARGLQREWMLIIGLVLENPNAGSLRPIVYSPCAGIVNFKAFAEKSVPRGQEKGKKVCETPGSWNRLVTEILLGVGLNVINGLDNDQDLH